MGKCLLGGNAGYKSPGSGKQGGRDFPGLNSKSSLALRGFNTLIKHAGLSPLWVM
jgi:hypothetical protein